MDLIFIRISSNKCTADIQELTINQVQQKGIQIDPLVFVSIKNMFIEYKNGFGSVIKRVIQEFLSICKEIIKKHSNRMTGVKTILLPYLLLIF